jgi:hypothetical protein
VSLADLYKLFSYANVANLKKLVATTRSLELSDRDLYLYKVCLLSNLYKQISQVKLN